MTMTKTSLMQNRLDSVHRAEGLNKEREEKLSNINPNGFMAWMQDRPRNHECYTLLNCM